MIIFLNFYRNTFDSIFSDTVNITIENPTLEFRTNILIEPFSNLVMRIL